MMDHDLAWSAWQERSRASASVQERIHWKLSNTLMVELIEHRSFDQAISCTQDRFPDIAARMREWLEHARADLAAAPSPERTLTREEAKKLLRLVDRHIPPDWGKMDLDILERNTLNEWTALHSKLLAIEKGE